MKICNIKISLKFKHPFYKKEKSKKKIVSKVKSWTMIQYLHSPHLVNLTGLKSSDEVVHAIDFIEKEYQNECIHSQIDCCMISHRDNKRIKLCDAVNELKNVTNLFYVNFDPELFTGCFLKPHDRSYPTINLFHTGSYQLFGGKSIEKIEESVKIVSQLIYNCENGVQAITRSKRRE